MKSFSWLGKGWVSGGAAILLICIATAITFHAHLAGEAAFPWDFQGMYHTHAVARMRDGSFLAPPLWLPWGGFGIPGHLSLQDGTWYIPQYLFDFLGWKYDLVGAVRLQVVHVALGSIGMYVLLRRSGACRILATSASLAYLFNPSFFSNAQHVDIVRGAAMFPWLILLLLQVCRKPGGWSFLLFAVLLWQFLVGAYPGMIVSTAYACAAIVAVEMHAGWRGGRSFGWLPILCLAVFAAVGLSAVKFLPLLFDGSNIRQSAGSAIGFDVPLLTTLVLGFDVAGMSNDLTMRALFFSLPILCMASIGIFAGGRKPLPYLLLIIGLLPMIGNETLQKALSHLPLMEVSRFHISDFRPVLQLALCLFAMEGYRVFSADGRSARCLAGLLFWLLSTAALFAYGRHVGQPGNLYLWPTAAIGLLAIALFLADRTRGAGRKNELLAGAFFIGAVAVSGFGHVVQSHRVWVVERSDALEAANYGAPIGRLISRDAFSALEYRPARHVFGTLPAGIDQLYDQRYNFAWYAQGFSAFGYEHLKGSEIFTRIYGAAGPAGDAGDEAAMRWMLKRSSWRAIGPGSDLDVAALENCEGFCTDTGGAAVASVRLLAYRLNGAVYDVVAHDDLIIVENEPYYPGWTAMICSGQDCGTSIDAKPMRGVLRSWSLPAGEYRLVTHFEPPGWKLATIVSLASIFVMLIACVVLLFRGRRAPDSSPS